MEQLEKSEEIKLEISIGDTIKDIIYIADKLKQVVTELKEIENRIITIKKYEGSNNLNKERMKELEKEYSILTNKRRNLEKIKSELENKIVELLKNDRIYILYYENTSGLYPAIVIPEDLPEYLWIDLSPTLRITIKYSSG